MTKKGTINWLVSVSGAPKALIKRDCYRFAVHWLQAGCCKWNREAQTLHKFQQFVKWLQKLQREINFQPEIEINEYSSSKKLLEYSSSTRVLEYSRHP